MAYGKMRDIFKGKIPFSLKRKAFDQCILPVLSYDCKTWSLTRQMGQNLKVTQRRMERSMLGTVLRDQETKQWVRSKANVQDIFHYATHSKWRWAGHIARCNDGR
jgi:hypothetical protein